MSRQIAMRLCAFALFCALAASAGMAGAAELVMVRRDGCPWCAHWDRDIGHVYPKTDIARRAPLRMVNLDRGSPPAVRMRSPVHYTPTFLLVENGEEVGRIEGYPGEAFFWGLLERLIDQLPEQSPNSRAGASS